MRIRRRPPGQPLLAYLLPTDPPTAPQPQPPPRASTDHQQERPPPVPGDKQGEAELHLHPASATNHSAAADLGDARSSSPLRSPALPPPQDGAVEQRSISRGLLGAPQQQQQQQGPADGRSSLENGHHRLSNGVGAAAAVAATTTATTGAKATKRQQETKDTTTGGSGGSVKRAPRGPGILMEGSRCSRKNGRGWRCSQPTLVGYALCQYHLGKGRMRSASAATGGRGPAQLGRTEHAKKTSAAAVVAPAAASPKADVPLPPPPPPQQQQQQQSAQQHC